VISQGVYERDVVDISESIHETRSAESSTSIACQDDSG
jgi:hypothetical protein